ncbi:MAG: hypothetical protein L6Q80_12390, partial [Dehalococcoidia bacterium]|nr:hypothetical protein [Dehalococcoidia bacterium]
VDIAETLDLKRQALLKHPSQLDEDIASFAEQFARWSAQGQEMMFAESFRRIIFDEPFATPATRATGRV